VEFLADTGDYAVMVYYSAANIVHVSTIVLEIYKNISKGAESGFYPYNLMISEPNKFIKSNSLIKIALNYALEPIRRKLKLTPF
jgi:hypothetical protein